MENKKLKNEKLRISPVISGGTGLCIAWNDIKNNIIRVKPSENNCLYVITEEAPNPNEVGLNVWSLFEYDSSDESRGQIIFGNDITEKDLDKKHIKENLPEIFSNDKNKNDVSVWTIGRYVSDTYTDECNINTFNELSFVIDCHNVSKSALFSVANSLRALFKESSILVNYKGCLYTLWK